MAKFGPNIANKEDDDTIIEDVITNKKLLKGWKWIIYDDESGDLRRSRRRKYIIV